MYTYVIGDIHGCFMQLNKILCKIKFDLKKDTLLVTGDLVSRGLNSLLVLRYLKSFGNSVKIVLGNHDLKLLSVFYGIEKDSKNNNFTNLLNAPDIEFLINWLRKQKIMYFDFNKKIIMSHAGIFPYWTFSTLHLYAKKIENYLSGPKCSYFLKIIKGDFPSSYRDCFTEANLCRFIINTFTRMRYCFKNYSLNFKQKKFPISLKEDIFPWFDLKSKLSNKNNFIFFGHWSDLRGKKISTRIFAMDSGCCWGGSLRVMKFEDGIFFLQKCFF